MRELLHAPRAALVALLLLRAAAAAGTAPLVLPSSALSAAAPPWDYTGFTRFPSFYFGGNEAGPQSPAELAFVAKFSLPGWGWQQSFTSSGGRHGEAQGAAAATALRSAAPPCTTPVVAHLTPSPPTAADATLVYRQSESIFTYYDLMEAVSTNATLQSAAALADPVTKVQCGGGGLLGFANSTFTRYWSEVVGGEVAAEGNVSGVFFDGFDKLYSPGALAAEGCKGFTEASTAAALLAKVDATASLLHVLAAGQRAAVLSTYNFFSSNSSSSAPPSPPKFGSLSGVTEDAYATAFAGLPWLRFYEVWMGHGEEQDTAMLLNAARETEVGIPFVARSDTSTVKTLEYPAAAFLIVQGPYCYWGASEGWTDAGWKWEGVYGWSLGSPQGPANRTSAVTWTRAFTRGTVTVDVRTARGSIVSW